MREVEFGWTSGSAPLPALGTAGVDDRRSSFALSRRDRRLSGIVTVVREGLESSKHCRFQAGEVRDRGLPHCCAEWGWGSLTNLASSKCCNRTSSTSTTLDSDRRATLTMNGARMWKKRNEGFKLHRMVC